MPKGKSEHVDVSEVQNEACGLARIVPVLIHAVLEFIYTNKSQRLDVTQPVCSDRLHSSKPVMEDTRVYSREFLCEFIELHRSLLALWKIKSKGYNDRRKKNGLRNAN
jgi:hypothetical protein